jgi:hypothetical protein
MDNIQHKKGDTDNSMSPIEITDIECGQCFHKNVVRQEDNGRIHYWCEMCYWEKFEE